MGARKELFLHNSRFFLLNKPNDYEKIKLIDSLCGAGHEC